MPNQDNGRDNRGHDRDDHRKVDRDDRRGDRDDHRWVVQPQYRDDFYRRPGVVVSFGFTGGNYAYQEGYADGLRDGGLDFRTGHSFRPTQDDCYRAGDRGFVISFGARNLYRQAYRDAYLQGYRQGYRY